MALALGTTVAELLERISSSELAEWLAYYRLEPFGQERDNLHAGLVAAAVLNVHRDPKKQRKPLEPGDFMLELDLNKVKPNSAKALYQALRNWAASFKKP